jgi:hypothetical protein
MTARDELIRDLKLWACSPRVPEKAQLLILEAIGALSSYVPQQGWRYIVAGDLPKGPPTEPGATLYAFDGSDGHWEYDLPALPTCEHGEAG